MECPVCGHVSDGLTAKFCSECGTKYLDGRTLPYIGASKHQGIFRITFAPVESEFTHEDAARDAARHSVWNEDHELRVHTIEFIRSTVTAETHPFICGECGGTVAEHTAGRCEYCGKNNWIPR